MARNSLLIKLLIFAFTYAIFSVMYMARELWIILKNDISSTLKLSTLFAGFLDFTFLFGIGIGYCFFAYIGTKRKLGVALVVGIFTIFLTVIGIGISFWNSVFGSAPILFLLFLLHGFAQSTVKLIIRDGQF
jgi:sugar phosphate permease